MVLSGLFCFLICNRFKSVTMPTRASKLTLCHCSDTLVLFVKKISGLKTKMVFEFRV